MKVLVTGASGFLGGAIVEQLVGEGHDVSGLVRRDEDLGSVQASGAAPVKGDLCDAASIASALRGVDAVVHAGGKVGHARRDESLRVNVGGLETLAREMNAAGVRRLIHLSSLRVLGTSPAKDADEHAPRTPTGDAYGDSKVLAEEWLSENANALALRAVVLRPGYVYGPRDRHLVPGLLEALRRGQIRYASNGENLFNPLYVSDVARCVGTVLALDPAPQILHLLSGEGISVRAFVEGVADLAALPRPNKIASPRMIELARGRWDEASIEVPPIVFDLLAIDRQLNRDRAREVLGFDKCVSLQDGLASTRRWLSEAGLLDARGRARPWAR